jgi:putative ABC transport system permease protein
VLEFANVFTPDVLTAFAPAVGAIALCLGVIHLCGRIGVRVTREAVVSIARGFIQMVAVGIVLAVLLHGNLLMGCGILLLMTVAAALTASRRLKGLTGSIRLSFWAIATGAGVAVGAMLAAGILRSDLAILVPVGSMIVANAMNACAQAAERFRADVTAHIGEIEAGLALGAKPQATVAPYVEAAVYASVLPRLDMLKSLGLVWIPGVMAGMMVSGASPLYAGIYQFVIVAMILVASAITGLVIVLLMRARAFSVAAQLLMRKQEV